VGLKHPDAAPDFGCTNLWVYNDADHDAAVARFAADPAQPFPVLFISFPSAKDPTFQQRYPGRSTIEVVAPAPYGWFAQWADTRWKKRGADYDQLKQGLARRLRNELEQHVPSVRGYIDYAELSTPLSTRHFANYQEGEIYGLSAVPARFRWRGLRARTPIRGLFLTGADVTTLGVTGALFGGVVTASLVLGRNLIASVTRPAPARLARAAA
jgi:all-trans-retinol 13,14-reductase